MRTLERTITAEILDWDELDSDVRDLFRAAVRVRRNAQAPYSGYKVGAAIAGGHGDLVYEGCNVERVSYSQCTHAEQNAVDTLVAHRSVFGTKVLAVAIVAAPADREIVLPPPLGDRSVTDLADVPAPCGHCLQIIWENCRGDPDIPLYAIAASGEFVKVRIGDALPFAFGPDALGISYD